jgi:hypothetical protein
MLGLAPGEYRVVVGASAATVTIGAGRVAVWGPA